MSQRQQIFTAVKTRFAAIQMANGYQTNIGAKLTEWHLTPKEGGELDGLDLRDETETTSLPDSRNSSLYTRQLQITAIAEVVEANDTATRARLALADIIRAIGVDPTWGGLARHTLPVEEEITVDGEGQRIGGARITFVVEYGRKPWAV